MARSGDDLQGNIAVSGAFALYPMMTVWAEEFTKLHPDVTFDVQGGGAGKGMTDTLAGAVDIGMISRKIKPEEEAQGAYWVAVAKDAVFPIVSAQNPVLDKLISKGIAQETFNSIFITGEIKTWGEVIGDPTVTDEIHVYTRSDSAGAADQWALFSGGKVQGDLLGIGVNGEPAHVDTVRKDPLGIGFSNLNSAFDPSSWEPGRRDCGAPDRHQRQRTGGCRRVLPEQGGGRGGDRRRHVPVAAGPFREPGDQGQADRAGARVHQVDPDRRPGVPGCRRIRAALGRTAS